MRIALGPIVGVALVAGVACTGCERSATSAASSAATAPTSQEAAPAIAVATPPSSSTGAPSESHLQDKFRQPERLIAALGLREGDAVAEVGAGSGYLSLRLGRAVGARGHVVSTDIEAALLETLASRARTAQLQQITTRLVPPDDPKLEAGAYDLVFLAQVDHLLPDRARYFRALLVALKPGGRIAISNRDRWKADLLAAVKGLPVRLVEDPVELPGQFLVFLVPEAVAPAREARP